MLELFKTPRDDLNVPCIEMWRRRFSTATGLACVAYTSWAPGSPGLCAGGLLRGEWAETRAWIQVSPLLAMHFALVPYIGRLISPIVHFTLKARRL